MEDLIDEAVDTLSMLIFELESRSSRQLPESLDRIKLRKKVTKISKIIGDLEKIKKKIDKFENL